MELIIVLCEGVFEFGWTEEEALKEADDNGFNPDECGMVCDDCYKLTPWGRKINNEDSDLAIMMLDSLRLKRDRHPQGEIRSAFNDVCDRLDVLISKLEQEEVNKKQRLVYLVKEMRKVAQPIGPLHSWWDLIFDIEAFLNGREPMFPMTMDEFIQESERHLNDD